MLRLLVLLLVLLNAVYYAWSHDMLRAYGYGPQLQSEPQRQAQQIRPEALRIMSADAPRSEVAQSDTPASGPACLQAGLFDEAQSAVLRQGVQSLLPSGSWSLEEVQVPPRWIIYMGKYADSQALARKRAELVALNLRAESVSAAALAPGLSLGSFETRERASAELEALAKRGVRTAQVVEETPATRANMLRITPPDDAVRAQLEQLAPLLAGKSLRPCP